jgi:hypothetical protein
VQPINAATNERLEQIQQYTPFDTGAQLLLSLMRCSNKGRFISNEEFFHKCREEIEATLRILGYFKLVEETASPLQWKPTNKLLNIVAQKMSGRLENKAESQGGNKFIMKVIADGVTLGEKKPHMLLFVHRVLYYLGLLRMGRNGFKATALLLELF